MSRHNERRLAEAAIGYVEDLRQHAADLRELITLLERYGTAKFGTEWFPHDPDEWLDEERAERLKELLKQV